MEELFPYLGLEEGGHMVGLLRQEQVLLIKERDLDIRDVMARAPSKRRGTGEDRGKRKVRRREEEDEEEREEVWPLPPLLGCPREGVLTVEGGAAHLGTLMTQVSCHQPRPEQTAEHPAPVRGGVRPQQEGWPPRLPATHPPPGHHPGGHHLAIHLPSHLLLPSHQLTILLLTSNHLPPHLHPTIHN